MKIYFSVSEIFFIPSLNRALMYNAICRNKVYFLYFKLSYPEKKNRHFRSDLICTIETKMLPYYRNEFPEVVLYVQYAFLPFFLFTLLQFSYHLTMKEVIFILKLYFDIAMLLHHTKNENKADS